MEYIYIKATSFYLGAIGGLFIGIALAWLVYDHLIKRRLKAEWARKIDDLEHDMYVNDIVLSVELNRLISCCLTGGLGMRLVENARLAKIIFDNSPEILKLNNHELYEILLQHEEFFEVLFKGIPELDVTDKYWRAYQEQNKLVESCDRSIYQQISDYVFKKE
jgi:hypothetical protein